MDEGGGEPTLAETAGGGVEGGAAAGHSLDGGGEVPKEGAGVGEVHEVNVNARGRRGRRGSIMSSMCGSAKNRVQQQKGQILCRYELMMLHPPDYTCSARADRSNHLQVDPAKEQGE